MADVPIPHNAEDYEAYKRSTEYLEEHLRCSTLTTELAKIQRLLERGMVSSEDVCHMLAVLVGEVEGGDE